jgi:hypothetical protein
MVPRALNIELDAASDNQIPEPEDSEIAGTNNVSSCTCEAHINCDQGLVVYPLGKVLCTVCTHFTSSSEGGGKSFMILIKS